MNVNIISKKEYQIIDTSINRNPLPIPDILSDIINKNLIEDHSIKLQNLIYNKYMSNNMLFSNNIEQLLFNMIHIWNNNIILVEPYSNIYVEYAKLCNKDYTILHTTYENSYKLNPEDLRKCPANSLLIFNNVCNSTGVIYRKEEVKNILNECKKLDITILSDETYYNLCKNNLYNIKKNYKKTIIISTISKDINIKGLTLSYIIFSNILKDIYIKYKYLHRSLNIEYSNISEHITYKYISNDIKIKEYRDKVIDIFQKTTSYLYNFLISNTKLSIVYPESGWSMFLNFKNYTNKLNNIGIINNINLSEYLISNYKILSIPGHFFGNNEMTLCLHLTDLDVIETNIKVTNKKNEIISRSHFIWNYDKIIKLGNLMKDFLNELK